MQYSMIWPARNLLRLRSRLWKQLYVYLLVLGCQLVLDCSGTRGVARGRLHTSGQDVLHSLLPQYHLIFPVLICVGEWDWLSYDLRQLTLDCHMTYTWLIWWHKNELYWTIEWLIFDYSLTIACQLQWQAHDLNVTIQSVDSFWNVDNPINLFSPLQSPIGNRLLVM